MFFSHEVGPPAMDCLGRIARGGMYLYLQSQGLLILLMSRIVEIGSAIFRPMEQSTSVRKSDGPHPKMLHHKAPRKGLTIVKFVCAPSFFFSL